MGPSGFRAAGVAAAGRLRGPRVHAAVAWIWLLAMLATTPLGAACDRGDLGDEPVARCVPEGACDAAMFEGGIKASLGDAGRGARLWADNCVRCHGEAGVGVGDAAAIDMTSPAWHASLRDAMIVKTVRGGRGMRMPAFTFDDQPLRDLLAYVRRLEVRPKAIEPKGGY